MSVSSRTSSIGLDFRALDRYRAVRLEIDLAPLQLNRAVALHDQLGPPDLEHDLLPRGEREALPHVQHLALRELVLGIGPDLLRKLLADPRSSAVTNVD